MTDDIFSGLLGSLLENIKLMSIENETEEQKKAREKLLIQLKEATNKLGELLNKNGPKI
jgi:hypothetical protein